MRIGIDARFLTHPQKGGFKTYTENLVSALADVDPDNQYFLYLDRQPDQYSKIPDKPNFTNRIVPSQIPMLGMLWREQILLPRQAQKDQLDLLHSPCLSAPLRIGCASVVTIHDVIWLSPNRFSSGNNQPKSVNLRLQDYYYRIVSHYAAKRASAILTVSEYSKSEIVQYLGLPADNIFVTYEAASCIYLQVNDDHQIDILRNKFDLHSKFILSIGSADPRKNINNLLHAYAKLPRSIQEQYQLVVVWTHDFLASTMKRQVTKLGLSNQVRFLEWVSDEELVLLYNAASLFVFPSLYEGFGLPLVEAMACGTPVLAAEKSSIPEIVGESALLIDPNDLEDICGKIVEVLADEDLRIDLSNRGLFRVADFSWEKCARETIDIYEKAYEERATG